jgi:hypothetical protein
MMQWMSILVVIFGLARVCAIRLSFGFSRSDARRVTLDRIDRLFHGFQLAFHFFSLHLTV